MISGLRRSVMLRWALRTYHVLPPMSIHLSSILGDLSDGICHGCMAFFVAHVSVSFVGRWDAQSRDLVVVVLWNHRLAIADHPACRPPNVQSFLISLLISAARAHHFTIRAVVANYIEISWKLITPSATITHQTNAPLRVVTDVSLWSEKSTARARACVCVCRVYGAKR